MKEIHILGIPGSLRESSFNKATLVAAQKLLPSYTTLEIFDLVGIPAFNQDYERNLPQKVTEFKEKIVKADAILFATPEYNYSVPGVLKNAIDWASRPYGKNAWDGKPVAIMSASVGMLGGARAQYHLRQIFVFLNMFPLNQPEVIIPNIGERIDAHGDLVDDHTKEKIQELLQALLAWTLQLQGKSLPKERSEQNEYDNYYARGSS